MRVFLVLLIFSLPTTVFAAPKFRDSITVKRGDQQSEFKLDWRNNLYRTVRGKTCHIGSYVSEIIRPLHKKDSTLFYTLTNRTLYSVRADKRYNQYCRGITYSPILKDVTNFKRVASPYSAVVGMASNFDGVFQAWDSTGRVVQNVKGMSRFRLNHCYGVPGIRYSQFVGFVFRPLSPFARDRKGEVLQINGLTPLKKNWTKQTYRDLGSFYERERICQK